jgi:hypothetical protein
VVDVTDGADVHVRLVSLELLLAHSLRSSVLVFLGASRSGGWTRTTDTAIMSRLLYL